MSIVKQALEWVCSIWFTIIGVNSADMVLWNKKSFKIRPSFDDNGVVTAVTKYKVLPTQYIKIPKRHGMMSAFLEGKIIPAVLLDSLGDSWRLDTERKTDMVKLLCDKLLAEWKRAVADGREAPDSSPLVAWFHPTANRQPESLVYISTPEVMGEYAGMDPYAQVERLNKALGPASTPAGWEVKDSSHMKTGLTLLSISKDAMEMLFKTYSLSVEDGPVILKDYATKLKPYVSDVGKAMGVSTASTTWKNLAFQIRIRGWVKVNGGKRRIIAKCNCNGGTEIVHSVCVLMGISPEVEATLDGVWRDDNIKSKNVKPGDVVNVSVKAFEIAKTANILPENSSSLGVQAIVGHQSWSRILHKEHSVATIKNVLGEEEKAYRAVILRKAIWEADVPSNLFILVGDKKEISMQDFKSISTAILCNAVVDPDTGKLKVVYTESWLNTLIPRWLRFLRDKVWTIQGSKYSQYIGAARVLRRDNSVLNELDDLKLRHFRATGVWIYPVLPPKEAIIHIALEGWLYVNRKKDPQTSALNMQGCAWCYRDEDGALQYLDINLQNIGVLARIECSGMPNAWATPTSDEFGEDKDGDLLSILLSKLIHFGGHAWYYPRIPAGSKDAVKFERPTTLQEWDAYIGYIKSQYDGYAIAAKNTGMLDLETRLQCAVAIVKGNLSNGIPFNNPTQRMFNYIREELGIKVSKHGVGGKTGTAMTEDPQELLRSLTYGEIEWKAQPHIFKATHKYGGTAVKNRWNNRLVLQNIMTSVLHAERVRRDGTKIDFFLDYALNMLRRAREISAKMTIPSPDLKGSEQLAKEYAALWKLKKDELSKGCIFTPANVITFVGEKVETFVKEGVRGVYSDLSSSYNNAPNKNELFKGLSFSFTYLLSWMPYHRLIVKPNPMLRAFAVSKYLRFKPVEALLHKAEADLTPEERFDLEDKGWLDKGYTDPASGDFQLFEQGFKNFAVEALYEVDINTLAKTFPPFNKIEDAIERIRQVNMFLTLCIIYTGSVGFGSGRNRKTGVKYTKTATINNYYPPECYIEAARMRYEMTGVKFALLDELPSLWAQHDSYVANEGYTVEDTDLSD